MAGVNSKRKILIKKVLICLIPVVLFAGIVTAIFFIQKSNNDSLLDEKQKAEFSAKFDNVFNQAMQSSEVQEMLEQQIAARGLDESYLEDVSNMIPVMLDGTGWCIWGELRKQYSGDEILSNFDYDYFSRIDPADADPNATNELTKSAESSVAKCVLSNVSDFIQKLSNELE
ncbi:MAG: hypothetical protein LBQ02_03190 [Candidatus Nomurabacteria bacterium]|jgi:hypothetical protein|nr:hypothetical protein [Candidatus Nomurabacteria bacterium]